MITPEASVLAPVLEEPAITEQLSLLQSMDPYPLFHVRESHRARRMSIQVHPHGQVEVVVPSRTRSAEVRRFVGLHMEWIRKAQRELGVEAMGLADLSPRVIDFRFTGQRHVVEYRDGARPGVRWVDGKVVLQGLQEGQLPALKALQRWTREQARKWLVPRLTEQSLIHGLPYSSAHIRIQRTRWGSCSSEGTISLNAAAMFLAPELVDYLFLHELCHTRQMNHSRRFWSLLESKAPGSRQLDRELNRAWRQVPPWLFRR